MRKIYVLDENNELKEIDAGITQYSELQDAPIYTTYNGVKLVGSKVELVDEVLTITEEASHKWTEEELLIFCKNANGGRYDILTNDGYEILLIDLSQLELQGRRYRRISVDADRIWDNDTEQWLYISDTEAKQLIYKFLNESEVPGSVVVGDPFVLKFYYYSNVGTARITATITYGKTTTNTFTVGTIASGETQEIDLTKYIKDGEQTISIKFANSAKDAFVPELTVNGININYTPSFDQYQPFSDTIPFTYSCSGSAPKVIYFDITRPDGTTTTVSTTHESGYFGGNMSLNKSLFAKGINKISTYMCAVDDQNNEIARTVRTEYEIPFLTDSEPLLMVYFNEWSSLKQYASVSLPYYVWCKDSGDLDKINFALVSSTITGGRVDYEYTKSDTGAVANYLQYNAKHSWIINSLPTSFKDGADLGVTFSIVGSYNGTEVDNEIVYSLTNEFKKENVTIESSSSAMQTVNGYKFNFAANDLVNKAMTSWISTGEDQKEMALNGFNWSTDGVKIDDEGNQALHFAPAARAILTEESNPLFSNYNVPYTLELSFKVSASASEQPIIKYYDANAVNKDNYGLFIYPNKAVFKYEGGSSEINYVKGERTHLAYTICNKQVTDTDPTGNVKTANILYLMVYINGILSQMKSIDSSTKFPSQCGTIEFNTGGNDFDLYAFRGYSFAFTSAQVLQNYISGFGDATKKEQIYLSNNLYSDTVETGVPGEFEIEFDKVKGKIPCYVVVTDALPETKDYNSCYGIYYEQDGGSRLTQWKNGISLATTYYYTREAIEDEAGKVTGYTPWVRNKKIKVGGQGTSSLAYPRKNLKFKHNDKFYIKGHEDGPDKTFTFKADYMDSSGANNIGNAQVLDDAIIRSKWISTPVATKPNLRVNLDGFPVAVFWCKSSDLKGGVVQDENAENVYDNGYDATDEETIKPLQDAITVNAENPLIGEVTPLNPKYIGTFNFNYDKKAKDLLGWNKKNFQGFEFRGNSSKCDLYRGFENFSALASTSEGFEWRWTYCSDYIDDYHDGHLNLTIDGGYFDEDVKQKYNEKEYLAKRDKRAYIEPFNRYYIERDGKQLQLFVQNEDSTYSPINYGTFEVANLGWNITDCEGISKPDKKICLEYGVKFGEKDGVMSFLYQLPYGIHEGKTWGAEYPDGSHYYKFDWNPEHEFKFEFNENQEYWINNDNWTALASIDKIKALSIEYTANDSGDYVYDTADKMYHLVANYPEGTDLSAYAHYDKTETYLDVLSTDKIITWDYMKHIFKNWAYVIEAVSHSDDTNYKAIFDSRSEWGNNGTGLFVWDAMTNYMAASIMTGLCDNFAKNMFMHSYDGGLSWSPAWYDMDTCFGLNNEGAYTKMYDIDFMDKDTTGARAFNGSNSKLWELIYYNSMDDLKSMYQELRSNNYIGYNKIMDVVYGENIKYKSEAMYNANAVFRYMEPIAWHNNVKPEAAQGNRLQLLKYWNGNREVFMDSRYEGVGWTGDIITLRLNNTEDVEFKLVPDTNMFLGINFNSGNANIPSVKSSEKVLAGSTWSTTRGLSTNLNTYIYGASHLLEIGDMSLCNSTEYSIATATNLRELKIGDEVHPPLVATKLALSEGLPYSNLTKVDLTNVQFSQTVSLNLVMADGKNLMPALQELKLKGSSLENLTLGDYTPITFLSLPDGIKKIILTNQLVLDTVEIYGTDSIEAIYIQNCPSLNQLDILNKVAYMPNIAISADNLQCDEAHALSTNFINWLYNANAELGGDIWVASFSEAQLQKYREKWNKLNITLKRVIPTEVIYGITGEGGLDE